MMKSSLNSPSIECKICHIYTEDITEHYLTTPDHLNPRFYGIIRKELKRVQRFQSNNRKKVSHSIKYITKKRNEKINASS